MRSIARRKLVLAGVVAASALFAHVEKADAQGGPKADVLVIHATECKERSVDPAIGEAPPLKYNCYKLIERKSLPLVKGQPATTPLPNGRTFQLTYGDQTAGKYKVSAAISRPDNKGFNKLADITAEPNKAFTVGGFAYQGGALVLTIKIVP